MKKIIIIASLAFLICSCNNSGNNSKVAASGIDTVAQKKELVQKIQNEAIRTGLDKRSPELVDSSSLSRESIETLNNIYNQYSILPDKITWKKQTAVDEMTDATNIWVTLKSSNYKNFEFPYEGDTYLTITVRKMKQYGIDVILSLDRGQIIGNDFDGTNYVTIRFDNRQAKRYYFSESSDNDSKVIFLHNTSGFISEAKKATRILIQVPVYEEGNPTFEFNPYEPLEWQ